MAMRLYKKFKDQWERDAPLLKRVVMSVPKSSIGRIIGPKGSNIKRIRLESGAIVSNDGDDAFIIIGKQEAVTAAQNEIDKIILKKKKFSEKLHFQ